MNDQPQTKTMQRFLKKEAHRVVGISIEPDGVFIYTNSDEWCDDAGAGTWREDSETAVVKDFYSTVQRPQGYMSAEDKESERAHEMRVTINNINAAIEDLGYEIVKGESYFYFWPLTTETQELWDSMVCTMHLTDMDIEEWRLMLVSKITETNKRF